MALKEQAKMALIRFKEDTEEEVKKAFFSEFLTTPDKVVIKSKTRAEVTVEGLKLLARKPWSYSEDQETDQEWSFYETDDSMWEGQKIEDIISLGFAFEGK